MLTVGSLFAGIGGFDLGFERAGFEIKWQVEIDPYCRAVLAKHWPQVRRYEDVREVGEELERVDVICGGFPCQDISFAGSGIGLDGERSGLWRDYARLVGVLRPAYVVVENVAALLDRGVGRVFGDLAAHGYDAEWAVLSACAFGAPHTRERLFIVAHSGQERRRSGILNRGTTPTPRTADQSDRSTPESRRRSLASWWETEPVLDRLAYGVSDGVGQLGGYGNAVVPQIAQWIAERIKEAEGLT